MSYDWTNLLNALAAGIVSVGAFVGAAKKWPWIFKGAVYLEQHAGEIVKTAEAIAETPVGALVKNTLHHEVDKANEKLQQSEIGRLALVGLHSFNTSWFNLSDTQEKALVHFVRTSTPPEWNVTNEQIVDVLGAMQQAAEDFSQLEIVKAANLFTNAAKVNTTTTSVNTSGATATTTTTTTATGAAG